MKRSHFLQFFGSTLATLSFGQLEAKAIDYYKQSLVITKEIRDVNLQALE